MAFSFAALQREHCTQPQCAVHGFSSARCAYKHFLAVSQSLSCPCSSRSANCVRRETLAGLAFRRPGLSTQHHNSGKEEENGLFVLARSSGRDALPPLRSLQAVSLPVVLGSEKAGAESSAICRRCAGCKGKRAATGMWCKYRFPRLGGKLWVSPLN